MALLAALLFALIPAVQAYCSVDQPGGREAALAAAEDTDAGYHTACCDGFPDVAVDDRMSLQDGAPLAGKSSVADLVVSPGPTTFAFAAALHPLWRDRAPPEPAFRRFPRLLL